MTDIEFGISETKILANNNDKNDEYIGKLCASLFTIFCLIILFTPFIVMDSIALSDTQCVNQNVPLKINLQWWIQADLALLCISLFFGSIYIIVFMFIKSTYETCIFLRKLRKITVNLR
jgi:hypothetical protein